MVTRIRIKNFKRFGDVQVELGARTVLIGPNDSGKTSALQALALWELGLRRWNERHGGKDAPEKRPGVTISRRDLMSMPVPNAKLLWRDLHVREIERVEGKQQTQNVRIDITVEGLTQGREWVCGLEFDYANQESLYCRPLRTSEGRDPRRMPVPDEAASVRVAFLQPMSGLAATEPVLEAGRVQVLLGEGQTAQVLRNLCYQIWADNEKRVNWDALSSHMRELFGIELVAPEYIAERGEITMAYKEHSGTELDLACSGRGCQQTLLVLAYLYANPGMVLLLDEPDAHLEILRQRQIYQLVTEVAERQDSQVVAASHSEVLLNEAADRDTLVAFVGRPHRIDDRGSQVSKALRDIGFDQYYQAEQTGWVLYVEGSTDLATLRAFAEKLAHPAQSYLERPFVHYVGNQPGNARSHFYGLLEAKPDLVGVAIFDRLEGKAVPETADPALRFEQWQRREIENYLCTRDVLMRYARGEQPSDLFSTAREQAMSEAIDEVTHALATLSKPSPWSPDIKASDEFLDALFDKYSAKLGVDNVMRKTNYHVLASLMEPDEIPDEVADKLTAVADVASRAKAAGPPT